jgi:hypothetical protein
MTKRYTIIGIAALVTAAGGGWAYYAPISVANNIRNAALDGDVDAFMRHVDQKEMAASIRLEAIERLRRDAIQAKADPRSLAAAERFLGFSIPEMTQPYSMIAIARGGVPLGGTAKPFNTVLSHYARTGLATAEVTGPPRATGLRLSLGWRGWKATGIKPAAPSGTSRKG